MFGSKFFQIVHGDVELVGELTASSDLPKGTMMDDQGDNVNCNPSQPAGGHVGFLTKDISTTGPTFERMTLGYQDLPELSPCKVSLGNLEHGGQIEIENEPSKAYNASTGAQLMVTTGTGAITAATAKGTPVSWKNGRLYAAQTGDLVWGRMLNAGVTPQEDAANIRVRVERIAGYIK